jgi:pimeloyl-ACP methyl ester carboxylesterase
MISTSYDTKHPKRARTLKWTLRSLGALAGVIAALALSGAVFEAAASHSDAANLSAPGRLVDVGGFRLHLNCIAEGSPTVVLDAGLSRDSLDWSLVQPEVARTTRVCAYDRAGMGWSEASPHPRTPEVIAEELHTLLANADIAGPYVLVAHSLAGKYARMFAIQHPSEVAGVVLVDARHEYMDEITTAEDNQAFFAAVDAQGAQYAWARRLGVVRTFGSSLAGTPAFSPATRSTMALLATSPSAIAATRAEARKRGANDADLRTANLGRRPLIVLAAGQSLAGIPHWDEAQQSQASLSARGEIRIAQASSHCIQCDDPALAIEAIEDVVSAVRTQR